MLKESIGLYTTLVLNHLQRLSGSKLVAFLLLLTFLSSCSVLKPTPPVQKTPSPPEKPVEPESSEVELEKPTEERVNSVVLLLPFDIQSIKSEPTRADVKRVEIPLDFYQGFEMAMKNLAEKGHNFKLTVLDSRDNIAESARLAIRPEVQSADLIVGPIFPKEIPAFSKAGKLTYSLQVSPLAASKPSQFNIPNLVSLVAPIDLHSEGLAKHLEKIKKAGDNIVIINRQDEDSRGFLNPLKANLMKRSVYFTEIENVEQFLDGVNSSGRNYVVLGTTNKYTVNSILNRLIEIKNELGIDVELFGHPNWLRNSYDPYHLETLKAKVTTSYYVNHAKSNVRDFEMKYKNQFKVSPSEYAYKGFDTGYFFGYLLGKYGSDYTEHLVSEEYNGLQTNYTFEKNNQWGYVNTYIRIIQFDGHKYVSID